MQRHFFQKKAALTLCFAALLLSAFTIRPGLDSYEIYLNNKLLLKQYVNQPLTLSSLQLTQQNAADQLKIYYAQCNMPDKIGKSRSISVKDEDGTVLKTWKFADASGKQSAMVIPVKEVLQLEKANAGKALSLFYAAEGHGGQRLANFHLGQKSTAYQPLKDEGGDATAYQPLLSLMLPLSL